MNKYKTKYNKKCTTKNVTFYIKDTAILKFANSINFQCFVKDALKHAIIEETQTHEPNPYRTCIIEKKGA